MTEAALIRLLLNTQVTGRPFPPAQVLDIVRGMRTHPRWRWLTDDSSLTRPEINVQVLVGYRQVTELHLVNLAASKGCALVTFDSSLAQALAPEDRRHVHLLTH